MSQENVIQARLDQIEELVEFEDKGERLPTFNAQIKTVCESIDGLMQDILKMDPSLQKYDTATF